MGAPRSGTTWLHAMLAHHPVVLHHNSETTFFGSYVKPLEDEWKSELEHARKDPEQNKDFRGIASKISERDFAAVLGQFVNAFYENLNMEEGKTHYLEKAPDNVFAVHTIKRFRPDAKFIHIIRDGRNMAVSSMATRESRGWGARNASAGALSWKRSILAGREARDAYPGDYLEVFYESLLADCKVQLKGILDFCNIDCDEVVLDDIVKAYDFSNAKLSSPTSGVERNNGKSPAAWKTKMGPWDRYMFCLNAGDLLKDLGYAEDDWWYANKSQRIRLELEWRVRRMLVRGGRVLMRMDKR